MHFAQIWLDLLHISSNREVQKMRENPLSKRRVLRTHLCSCEPEACTQCYKWCEALSAHGPKGKSSGWPDAGGKKCLFYWCEGVEVKDTELGF